MKGFQQVNLNGDKSAVDIGPGNIWDNVYSALDGSGVNVVSILLHLDLFPIAHALLIRQVGGRVSGIGAGGFITGGGGFSWKTSQYGKSLLTLSPGIPLI